jgi:hypothetical protein
MGFSCGWTGRGRGYHETVLRRPRRTMRARRRARRTAQVSVEMRRVEAGEDIEECSFGLGRRWMETLNGRLVQLLRD